MVIVWKSVIHFESLFALLRAVGLASLSFVLCVSLALAALLGLKGLARRCAGVAPDGAVVTEAQWLSTANPKPMLLFLAKDGKNLHDRKLRLFACACCRRIWHLLPSDASRQQVATIEDHPEMLNDQCSAIEPANPASSARERNALRAVEYLVRGYANSNALGIALTVASWTSYGDKAEPFDAERTAQAALVRDIFPNPFRPVPAIVESWQTSEVKALAREVYEQRDFTRLPALADALQGAGCADAEILGHFRSDGPHVRGCWALDLVLGET